VRDGGGDATSLLRTLPMVVAEIDAGKRRRRRKEEESLAGRHPVEGERLC
jgi:hypothetical protein